MQCRECFSFVRRISQIGTLLYTAAFGKKVGGDEFGTTYYTERNYKSGLYKPRRWAIYNGEPEPSKIPPDWHAWLHHITDMPLTGTEKRGWQKPHKANMTGTSDVYISTCCNDDVCAEKSPVQAWKPE